MIVHLDEDERELIIEMCAIGFKSCGDTLKDYELTNEDVNDILSRVCCYQNIIEKLIKEENYSESKR